MNDIVAEAHKRSKNKPRREENMLRVVAIQFSITLLRPEIK